MFCVVLREALLDVCEHRIGGPRFPRRSRLWHLGEPHLESLMSGVGRQQPMQRSGTCSGEPGDEDRALDRDLGMLGVLLPRRFAQQAGDQRPA